jgi:hypothetical protein
MDDQELIRDYIIRRLLEAGGLKEMLAAVGCPEASLALAAELRDFAARFEEEPSGREATRH